MKRFCEMSAGEADDYVLHFAGENDDGVQRFLETLSVFGVVVDPADGLDSVDAAWLGVRHQVAEGSVDSEWGSAEPPEWYGRLNAPRNAQPGTAWMADGFIRLSCAALFVEEPRCRWGCEEYTTDVYRNYPAVFFDDGERGEKRFAPLESTLTRLAWYTDFDIYVPRRDEPDYFSHQLRTSFLGRGDASG